MPLRIVVIGGGAAGFFAAIACAETHPHTQVLLLEAGRQLLGKVRISGGGRCNVTHACFDPAVLVQHYPRGSKVLRGPLSQFQPSNTIDWFAAHGVQLKTEPDGRMFPITDDSATIVDCLIRAAQAAGVEICTGAAVTAVSRKTAVYPASPLALATGSATQSNGQALVPARPETTTSDFFEIQLKSNQIVHSDRLLLATGSSTQGYQIAKTLGHRIEPPVPSLFTFNVLDPRLQDLAGVAVETAHLRLQVLDRVNFEQTGPLVITHWGLSGPAVLKLSAWAARALHDNHYQATLEINWLPQFNREVLRQKLLTCKTEWSRKVIAAQCPLPLPRRLWHHLVASVGIDTQKRWAELSHKTLNQLIQELTQGVFTVKGKGIFKEEFVTCGGVSLSEVNFKTLESRRCPGLYFAGEVLDIDGVTGGFNFQSAWTTAWIAGQAMGCL